MLAVNGPALRRLLASPSARFVAALALANAPFWLLGQAFFVSRGVANLDTAVALLVVSFAPAVGVFLLVIAWIADLALSLSLTFHFGSPVEFVRSIRFASVLQLSEFISWTSVALTIPFVACGLAALRLVHGHRGIWRAACLLTPLLALIDAFNGSSALSDRGTWRLPFNLAGSPVVTLAAQQMRRPEGAPLHALASNETVQRLVDVAGWATAHPDRSVLFVIVESLGSPNAPALRAWLSRQLFDTSITDRYELRDADIPFRGSTTAGEMRALCALAGSYRGIDASTGARCLPATLARAGWTTIGMHGFSQRMFDRQDWWPRVGLQANHFIDSPLLTGVPHCGAAFRGGCDAQLIHAAVKALGPAKRFVYLLTLNTHLPLAPTPLPPDLPDLCARAAITDEACELVGALGSVLNSTRAELGGLHKAPLVVVIGDHAPPFSRRSSRDAFSADRVPAFALIPRE